MTKFNSKESVSIIIVRLSALINYNLALISNEQDGLSSNAEKSEKILAATYKQVQELRKIRDTFETLTSGAIL